MIRSRRHPNLGLERLLQELEAEGVDPLLIESFVARSQERSPVTVSAGAAAGVAHESA